MAATTSGRSICRARPVLQRARSAVLCVCGRAAHRFRTAACNSCCCGSGSVCRPYSGHKTVCCARVCEVLSLLEVCFSSSSRCPALPRLKVKMRTGLTTAALNLPILRAVVASSTGSSSLDRATGPATKPRSRRSSFAHTKRRPTGTSNKVSQYVLEGQQRVHDRDQAAMSARRARLYRLVCRFQQECLTQAPVCMSDIHCADLIRARSLACELRRIGSATEALANPPGGHALHGPEIQWRIAKGVGRVAAHALLGLARQSTLFHSCVAKHGCICASVRVTAPADPSSIALSRPHR